MRDNSSEGYGRLGFYRQVRKTWPKFRLSGSTLKVQLKNNSLL
jgi:hypothetical protein